MDKFLVDLKDIAKDVDDKTIRNTYIKFHSLEYFILKTIAGECSVGKSLKYKDDDFSDLSIKHMKKIKGVSIHMIIAPRHAILAYFRDDSFTVFNPGNVSLDILCKKINEYTGKTCVHSLCVKTPQDLSGDKSCAAWAYLLAYLTCFYEEDPKDIENYLIENHDGKELNKIIRGFILYINQLLDEKGLKDVLNKYYHVVTALSNTKGNKVDLVFIVGYMKSNTRTAEKYIDKLIEKNMELMTLYDMYDNLSLYYLMKTAYSTDKKFFNKYKDHVFTSIEEFLDLYPMKKSFMKEYLGSISFFAHTLTEKDQETLIKIVIYNDELYSLAKNYLNLREFIDKRKLLKKK